jgi:cellulase/cellobiase CelA1
VASATATVAIQGGATTSCHVVYTKQSEWQGGFVASISITNTGTVPIYSWQLSFTFGADQQITEIWNAQYAQTGEAVKISGVASSGPNGSIAPGATVSGIGFLGTWHTSDAPPATFAVNGLPCA